jgi:hypothetical protein
MSRRRDRCVPQIYNGRLRTYLKRGQVVRLRRCSGAGNVTDRMYVIGSRALSLPASTEGAAGGILSSNELGDEGSWAGSLVGARETRRTNKLKSWARLGPVGPSSAESPPRLAVWTCSSRESHQVVRV